MVDGDRNKSLLTLETLSPMGRSSSMGALRESSAMGDSLQTSLLRQLGLQKSSRDFHLKKENLLHGVSFASAASGYEDLIANLTNVLFVLKQLAYLKHYKLALKRIVGQAKAEEIINNAIIVMSMGTNDFIQNYYLEPIRSKEFIVQQYTDYLIKCMTRYIKGSTPVTDEDLRRQFSEFGKIVSVKIPVRKGCGFVQFATKSNAEEALQGINGTTIGKNTVRFSWGRSPVNKQPRSDNGNQWNGGGAYYRGQAYDGSYGYAAPVSQDPNMYTFVI
ncbi:hypothetical protein GIB67_031503 [Kingdonia uniflora]|uniref:RRM domain-containing protein n=1 Tax=Kingdonia uniflora TaxID=39325 RepID=A0A7J7MNN7_9MAGN|nr:hypothetical protein GIB67_031503 [Kingdonia uniflora]